MTPEIATAIRVLQARSDDTAHRSRQLRARVGLSVRGMARLVPATPKQIRDWEAGRVRPTGPRAVGWLTVIEALEAMPTDHGSESHIVEVAS